MRRLSGARRSRSRLGFRRGRVRLAIGPYAARAESAATLLAASAGCALVLALTGCNRSAGTARAVPARAGSTYTLMVMNLCLSGVAGCYRKVDYPAGVEEAVARIHQVHPDAVTANEVCSGDAAGIAEQTGYRLSFSRVIYNGKPLLCVHPGNRGLFGDAVLTRAVIQSAESLPFQAQAGPERRQWLCVSTAVDVEVCTAHLASHETDEVAANGRQCAELRALLAARAAAHTVIFGGDVNRPRSCAPHRFWVRADGSAHQAPGSEHIYGTGALTSPVALVLSATHTDHDFLLVRGHLSAGR